MLTLSLFGTPHLAEKSGRIIYFEGRKELAILVVLARQKDRVATREYLAGLLWSRSERDKALASLRQSVRKLRRLEDETGARFLVVTRQEIGLDANAIRTDIEDIAASIEHGVSHALARASRLLAPKLMSGMAELDSKLAPWVALQERTIRSELANLAAAKLMACETAPDHASAALQRFLWRVEPGLARALETRLGPAAAHGDKSPGQVPAGGAFANAGADLLGRLLPPPASSSELLPVFYYVPGKPDPGAPTRSVQADLVDRISQNRAFTLLMDHDHGADGYAPSRRVGVNDADGGAFVLSVQEDLRRGTLSVDLKTRDSGRQVFYEILTVPEHASRADVAQNVDALVQAMEGRIRQHYHKNATLAQTLYGRISQINELSKQFDRKANAESLRILDRMEQELGGCSLIYAFKAAGMLKQRLFLEISPESRSSLIEAANMAQRAVAADPWNAYSHRMAAYALRALGRQLEEGKQQMIVAHTLAPSDPSQTIATAEFCAFVGDVGNALSYAEFARSRSKEVPRYYFGYMSHIQFAAENFEEAATLSARGPLEIMEYRAIRIAALWQLGKAKEARAEFSEYLARLQCHGHTPANLDVSTAIRWLCGLNPFSVPRTNSLYQEGIRQAATTL